ncbi:MAG: VWA domain-containing protein, partial [Acidimicrobiia bacterium]|nr:VWA domain-containing protein [Acidimicrobiia bacterium]
MNIGQWGLNNPAGLWWALLVIPIIALHILKPRRVRETVAAVFLWREVAKPVTAARPWQRLTPSWLLAAQVLAALLLALLLAGPVRLTPLALAEHTIFVIDSSASMQASDGSPNRLADALDRASELRGQVPAGGQASLVVAGANARALLTSSTDADAFDDALTAIEPYDGAADFDSAFALAAGLNTGDRPTRVVFISDGGISTDDLVLAPVGTRYERIGQSATNRGISRLSVEPSANGLVARIAVRHYGGPGATETVRVDVDGVTIERVEVELDSDGSGNNTVNLSVRLPPGEMIEAFLESQDSYLLDNRAVGTVARRPEISVLVVGGDNIFLDTALAVVPGLTVERLDAVPTTAEGDIDTQALADVDVMIADRVALGRGFDAADLPLPVWAIAPPVDGLGGIRVTGDVERPVLVSINPDSPLVAGLDLSELLLARAQDVEVGPGAEVVLGGDQGPLLVMVRRPGADLVYQTFALDESTLPLQAAFPVMVERLLTDLAQAVLPPARLEVGGRLPIDPRLGATVTDPLGVTVEIPSGATAPAAATMGFWRIEQEGRVPVIVAVNPPATESAIAPAIDLPFTRGFREGEGVGSQGEIPLRPWVLATLLAVLAAEWLLARRRVGVGPRQWTAAQVMRGAIALALIASLLNPGITLPTDRVATVFLVDGSDSMGFGGVSDGAAYVRDALEAKREAAGGDGGDDVAGVVGFARNARLENVVGDDPIFVNLSVELDPSATDISAALRLGAAALPNDARRRLVLISDGRATKGDVQSEADRLAEAGIPIDVVVIEPPSGADAA